MTPARVLFLVPNLGTGGRERMVQLLALHLDRARFAPEVLCFDFRGPFAEPLLAAGIPVHLESRQPGLLDPKLISRLMRRLAKDPPAIVHAHGTTATIYAAIAARLAGSGIQVVATEHGCSRAMPVYDKMLHEIAATLVHRHVAVSEDLRSALAHRGRRSRILVVPNGIPRPAVIDRAMARRELGLAPDAIIVGCVARLAPVKNHRVLLEAWRRLRAKLPPGALLLLVGDGAERAALEGQAAAHSSGESVRFLGEREDTARIFAALDVNVLASRYEAMSMTLLEASAAGIPSVATRAGGNAEVVQHLKTGLLVTPGDPQMLADAIRAIACSPDLSRSLGSAARIRFENQFTAEKMTLRYEALYDECMGAAGFPRANVARQFGS